MHDDDDDDDDDDNDGGGDEDHKATRIITKVFRQWFLQELDLSTCSVVCSNASESVSP